MIKASTPAELQVCISEDSIEGRDAASQGAVFLGPGGSTTMLKVPVTWKPESERPSGLIFMPLAHNGD